VPTGTTGTGFFFAFFTSLLPRRPFDIVLSFVAFKAVLGPFSPVGSLDRRDPVGRVPVSCRS